LSERKRLENIIFRIPGKLITNNAGLVLKYESMLEIFEKCQEIQVKDPFDGEERFISVGFGGRKEKEVMWKAWRKLYNLKGTGILEKDFIPSPFLNECRSGESSADTVT
jgi:hypothetical protein